MVNLQTSLFNLASFLAFRSNVKVHSSTGTKSGNLQETGAENWTTAKKWKTKEKKEVRDEKKTRQNQLRQKKKSNTSHVSSP